MKILLNTLVIAALGMVASPAYANACAPLQQQYWSVDCWASAPYTDSWTGGSIDDVGTQSASNEFELDFDLDSLSDPMNAWPLLDLPSLDIDPLGLDDMREPDALYGTGDESPTSQETSG